MPATVKIACPASVFCCYISITRQLLPVSSDNFRYSAKPLLPF
ncbi:hypothetical protein HMPREF9445_02345 [Bacteroides clarus YIT 12056]|uniref:Uncharacterized protein n=1 Tax=Bacteroides clarus YIT 12056 TaxID=762984 RepID=A0ABP2KS20_9BACE|nr:hypothetical protein HMPREF9445_02345 [Bacteroides clarus YIT 12056]